MEFVVDNAAMVQVFSQYSGFLRQLLSPLTGPQLSPSIIQDWYNRSINDLSNSGFGSTPAQLSKKISEEGRLLGYYAVWLL
jgi:hypothetical protein